MRNLIARKADAEAGDPAELAARSGTTPDEWQSRVLRSRAPQILLNCSRQAGKSTVTSFLALHKANYSPRSLTLLLAPSLRQSQELFRKVKDAHSRLPGLCRAKEESALRLEFDNGSRIVALPGKEETVRGFSGVDLLLVDEASRVADALYYSIRPMLAVSRGRIVMLSTPFGKRGVFFEEWTNGEGWERFEVTAYDCPRIPRDFIEAERRALPDFFFRSEYLCEFCDTVDSVFRYEDIEAATAEAVSVPEWLK